MNQALWIAKTGLDAQQYSISAITNNLANVSTVSYKKERAEFQDLLYQTVKQPGGQSSEDTTLPSGLMLGTGVHIVGTTKSHTQGPVIQTGNALDILIDGRGYLEVITPDGSTAYTRDGQLHTNESGELVTSNGYKLQAGITLPQGTTSITIGSDGVVSATTNDPAAPTQIGNLQIADFINPAGLQPIGNNMYKETVSSGAAQPGTPGENGLGTIVQEALEGSNVNSVEELVSLIETQRAYEMNSKSISAIDDMLSYANQVL